MSRKYSSTTGLVVASEFREFSADGAGVKEIDKVATPVRFMSPGRAFRLGLERRRP